MDQLPFQPTCVDQLMTRAIRNALPRNRRKSFDLQLAEVLESERPFLTDQVTFGHIRFVAGILCLYREFLRGGASKSQTHTKTLATIRNLLRRSLSMLIRLTFLFSRDHMKSVRSYSKFKIVSAYGPSFSLSESEIDGGFVSEVHICGYRTFLARHNALELNALLCEWDRIWIDALPKSIHFERPTTLAQGSNSCRFEFVESSKEIPR